MSKQLIISGSIAIDRLMKFDGTFGDKIKADMLDVLSVSILMDSLDIASGGVGANIATNAASLGMNPILLGSAGPDAGSYIDELKSIGINTEYIHRSNLPTATFTAFTDSDNNQLGGFYPGAMADAESLTLESWKDEDVLVMVSAHDGDGMRRQVQECVNLGLSLLYDPGQQTNNISGDDLLAGCKAADIVMVNSYELGVMSEKTGKSEQNLQSMPRLFITTNGSEGLTVTGKAMEKPLHVPALTIDNVVDPTGAGDAFRAGFIYGQFRDWDLEQSCKLGTVMASLIIELSGPRHALTVEAITTRFKQQYNEEIELI